MVSTAAQTGGDPSTVTRLLELLEAIDRREAYFRQQGIDSIETYRRRRADGHANDGYGDVEHGSSFIMAAQFVDGRCPVRAGTFVTYYQTENQRSKHAADYKANAEKYQTELAALHAEVKKNIAYIPKERRVLVTSHDAFRYFGAAYDIEVRGIQGISTETEAGLKNVNDLVDFIVSRQVKAVFVETSVNERNMESLVGGCKAKGHMVIVGGKLFSDAMGTPGTYEGTYVGMIDHNASTIARALGGEVVRAPRGLGGQGRFAVVRDPAGAVCALFEKA